MVNVSQNKGLISKSATTRSPIKYVPLLILHINGEPYMRYDGPHKIEEIKRFVIEIAQKVSKNKKPQSTQSQQAHNNAAILSKEKEVPAYTIGVPKNAGNRNEVCYLGFESAYVSK